MTRPVVAEDEAEGDHFTRTRVTTDRRLPYGNVRARRQNQPVAVVVRVEIIRDELSLDSVRERHRQRERPAAGDDHAVLEVCPITWPQRIVRDGEGMARGVLPPALHTLPVSIDATIPIHRHGVGVRHRDMRHGRATHVLDVDEVGGAARILAPVVPAPLFPHAQVGTIVVQCLDPSGSVIIVVVLSRDSRDCDCIRQAGPRRSVTGHSEHDAKEAHIAILYRARLPDNGIVTNDRWRHRADLFPVSVELPDPHEGRAHGQGIGDGHIVHRQVAVVHALDAIAELAAGHKLAPLPSLVDG